MARACEGGRLSRFHWRNAVTGTGTDQWQSEFQIGDRGRCARHWLGGRGVPPSGSGGAQRRRLKMAAARSVGRRSLKEEKETSLSSEDALLVFSYLS
ncbi:unnamed protein product [Coccothraustes coccothraustes]